MAIRPRDLSQAALEFLRVRHLATLTTLRGDGSPHVVPVGFTWEAQTGLARVITSGSSAKARHAAAGCRAVLCQVEGARWLSLEGRAHVLRDPGSVADAVERYTQRYRPPRVNPERVVIVVEVDRILGNV